MKPIRESSSSASLAAVPGADSPIPDYLARTYTWAYLSKRTLPLLDRSLVVSAILWGNANRLMKAAVAEFAPGQRIMQAASVYGDFSPMLARQVGAAGALEVLDVAQIQVENTRRKLQGLPWTRVRRTDLANSDIGVPASSLDAVCCFFLLHEVPDEARIRIVDNLLATVRVGGKAVFTDYHRMNWWNPLRPVMSFVFHTLEPYALTLMGQDITSLSPRGADFKWEKTTLFGGLYQKVVGVRLR